MFCASSVCVMCRINMRSSHQLCMNPHTRMRLICIGSSFVKSDLTLHASLRECQRRRIALNALRRKMLQGTPRGRALLRARRVLPSSSSNSDVMLLLLNQVSCLSCGILKKTVSQIHSVDRPNNERWRNSVSSQPHMDRF